MTMALSHHLVSVLVPVRDQVQLLDPLLSQLEGVLHEHFLHYEVVLIDDGSRDSTSTVVARLLTSHRHLRYLRLAKRFGLEAALSAGIEVAIGAVVVCLMPDSDPPEMIPELVQRCVSSGNVLMGRPHGLDRGRGLRSLGRRGFYWACRHLFDIRMEPHASYYLVFHRQAVVALNQIRGRSRFLRALHSYTGFQYETFDYAPKGGGVPEAYRRPWPELLALASEVIVSNSLRPLRAVALLAFAVATVNLLYAGYVVAINFFHDRVAEGWTTLSLQLAMTFWAIALTLAVIAEYVARLTIESQGRPGYFVADERISSVAAAEIERKNVVEHTELQ
jgi:glycosyltransferase involved in cell wall biosynthesis